MKVMYVVYSQSKKMGLEKKVNGKDVEKSKFGFESGKGVGLQAVCVLISIFLFKLKVEKKGVANL